MGNTTIPSKTERYTIIQRITFLFCHLIHFRDSKVNLIRRAFIERLYIGQVWSVALVACEILNFFNVILQAYITNMFLNDRFFELGVNILKYGYEASVDELEVVFPKVSANRFRFWYVLALWM